MTDKERIARLERLVTNLCLALLRKDTDRDGNWGFPSFSEAVGKIGEELSRPEVDGQSENG